MDFGGWRTRNVLLTHELTQEKNPVNTHMRQ